MNLLLEVENLHLRYPGDEGAAARVLGGVSLRLAAGATLGIAGESGSGKSQLSLAVMGLLPEHAQLEGAIRFEGQNLLALTEAQRRRLRGARIGMVFQDPMSSLNPHLNIGVQMAEGLQVHRGASRASALAAAVRMLDAVQLPDARALLARYPHQLSGGQRQRVMIAMTLLLEPSLLIADEPTTALDVTVQASLLRLLAQLRRDLGVALMLISHDMEVLGSVCEDLLVMYAGQVMERGPTAALLKNPRHPYTQALLACRPSLHGDPEARLPAIGGLPPDARALPPGCAFAPRCARAEALCAQPPPRNTHTACHFAPL